MSPPDRLTPILARKRREIERRKRHRGLLDPTRLDPAAHVPPALDAEPVVERLRRTPGEAPRVIAEIKHRSPSAGQIRARAVGGVTAIATAYVAAGASAVSVLADSVGFGGSVLDVRRVARTVPAPVLFKEFVLDPIQLDVARLAGARLCLLLVNALTPRALDDLVAGCFARGLEPLVEAANAAELDVALATRARVIGVNARDLVTFVVDPDRAAVAIESIPSDRVAVYMSGVTTKPDLTRLADTRADAVLIGSGLMSQPDPGAALARLLSREEPGA